MRIALGSMLTECNQFGGSPIDIEWFRRYDLSFDEEVLETKTGVVGGAISALTKSRTEIVPLINASTCPGGYITAECYKQLRDELLTRLRNSVPVDGVLLPLHGGSVAEGTPDPEGDIIQAVREIVGWQIPIVATLDLHAHVTPAMVTHANALLAWETYPHRDSEMTGIRGANLLVKIIQDDLQPAMAMVKVPVITGGILGGTDGDGAFAQLMRQTKKLEEKPNVLSSSLFLTHPYLDQPGMGSGALVVTDGDLIEAEKLAKTVSLDYWRRRNELEAKVVAPEEAIRSGLKSKKQTVVLVETADCSGGGAAGDSVATLGALIDNGEVENALVPVVDPEAAYKCHTSGINSPIELELGHRLDPRWGRPINVKGIIETLVDGHFKYKGGIWDGVDGNMGPSAVIKFGGIRVLITSYATYDWADEQWQAVGIDPRSAQFVVAKNPMNFNNVYEDHISEIYILDTLGPTPASVRNLPFQNLIRPFFPLDSDIPDLEPTVLS